MNDPVMNDPVINDPAMNHTDIFKASNAPGASYDAKRRVVVTGGGWSGIAAALSACKAGADVILIEKTDLLLGLGNVGGIMRNNGRFVGAEENIALGRHFLLDYFVSRGLTVDVAVLEKVTEDGGLP